MGNGGGRSSIAGRAFVLAVALAAPLAAGEPLTGAAAAAALAQPAAADGASTPFDPRTHGFPFVNFFTGDVLLDVPLVGPVDLGDTTYGLCGGMALSALDGFLAGADAPGDADPPPSGTELRSYLYGRQLDTLQADDAFAVRRLLAWAWRPVESNLLWTGLRELAEEQLHDVVAPRLQQGTPVPLLLIRSDVHDYVPGTDTFGPEGFTENHQVLAIGSRRCGKTAGAGEHWGIDVYDPNEPQRVCTLHLTPKKGRITLKVREDGGLVAFPDDPTQDVVGDFRGLFVVPCEPRAPFWAPGTSLKDVLGTLALLPALGAPEAPGKRGLPPLSGAAADAALDALLADAAGRLAQVQAVLAVLEQEIAAAEALAVGGSPLQPGAR